MTFTDTPTTPELSPEATACLRRIVAVRIAHPRHTLGQEWLDNTFGRSVWEEVAAAGYLTSLMYQSYNLTADAVTAALGWDTP